MFDKTRQRLFNWLDVENRSNFTEIMWNGGNFGGQTNSSGQVVTSTSALGLPAYFAGLRNISEDVAKVPIKMFRERKDGNLESVRNHDLLNVINRQPNPFMSRMNFWTTIMSHKIGFQGGFAEIVRDVGGKVTALWPIDPSTVKVIWDMKAESLTYEIQMDNGQFIMLDSNSMFHVRGMGLDGFTQYMLSAVGQIPIGRALAAQDMAAAHFGNGATLKGVLEAPPTLKRENAELLMKTFSLRHAGSSNAYKTPVVPDGVTYKTIESDPQKSQLIETSEFGVEDVARLLRIPPNKLQHLKRSSFSNIEEENRNYTLDSLMPHSVNICEEIQLKLLNKDADQNLLCKFDFSVLLEADVEKRTAVLVKEFQMGMWSTNELLRMKSMDEIGPDGDRRFVMSGVQPLDAELEPGPDEPIEPQPAPQLTGDMEGDDVQAAAPVGVGEHRAMHKMFANHIERFKRIQEDKYARATKSGKVDINWLNKFFNGHERNVYDSLIPCYEVLCTRHGVPPIHSIDITRSMVSEFREFSEKHLNLDTHETGYLTSDQFVDRMAARALQIFDDSRVKV